MSGGYILLHRKVLGHYLFKRGKASEVEAWVRLLLAASHSPHRQRFRGGVIAVGRGQVPTSYRKLAEEWGWAVNTVRGFLAALSREGMITASTDTGFLVITICNYGAYQRAAGRPDTDTDTEDDTGGDTEDDTSIKKGKKGGMNEKRVGSRLSLHDPPGDWIRYCVTQRPDLDPGMTFDKFRDYWIAKPGKDGLKLDWDATWRNWVRNEKTGRKVNDHGRQKSRIEIAAEGIALAAAKREQGGQGEA